MTTTAIDRGATHPPARRDTVGALVAVEARRALRGGAFWIGLALSALILLEVQGLDWQAGKYQSLVVGFLPLSAGIFVSGVLAGGRDRRGGDALAEEAALDATDRALARLLGQWPLVLAGTVLVAVVAVALRIEGGLWVGNRPGRTDDAVHGVFEILGPIVLFGVSAAAGVAAGRASRRRATAIVVGLMAYFLFVTGYWILQDRPLVYVTPVQTQPVANETGVTDPTTLPADWLLERHHDGPGWDRLVVSQRMAAAHVVYLAGVGIVAAALAIRSRVGRRLLAVGLVVAALGVAGQVVARPDGASSIQVPA